MIFAPRLTRDDPRRRLAWLLSLLALTVILPSAALLWLFARAGEHEREALQQRFRRLCQEELSRAIERWETHWRNAEINWRNAESYTELIREPLFAGAALLDPETGAVVFPRQEPGAPATVPALTHPLWIQARSAEFSGRRPQEAALLYHSIEKSSADLAERHHAWQSRVRCLNKAGQHGEALALWEEAARRDDASLDIWDTALYLFSEGGQAEALGERLRDWMEGNPSQSLPLSKRLFMMQMLRDGGFPCATEDAERLFATLTLSPRLQANTLSLSRLEHGLLQMTAPDRKSVVFLRADAVSELFTGATPSESFSVSLHGPEEKTVAYLERPLSGPLAGWTLALHPDQDANPLVGIENDVNRWTSGITALTLILVLAAALVLSRLILREARLNRLRNDFLATVSHEMKTPVTATRLLVDNLLRKAAPDPVETREYLGLISRENERLCRLIEHFLGFSRMELGKHVFLLEPLHLPDIAREAAGLVRERLADDRRRIHEEHAAELPLVDGDREALTTVVVNLLDNALKYSRADVSVTTSLHAGQVRIIVEDQGVGLTPEARRRAFEKFYRADPSLTNDTPGVGLGLSIVDFIVREHQGWVGIDSAPGKGSRFTVHLPIHQSEEATHG